jgi:hypothetical protein
MKSFDGLFFYLFTFWKSCLKKTLLKIISAVQYFLKNKNQINKLPNAVQT